MSVGGPLRCGGPFCCGALDCRIECQDRARLVVLRYAKCICSHKSPPYSGILSKLQFRDQFSDVVPWVGDSLRSTNLCAMGNMVLRVSSIYHQSFLQKILFSKSLLPERLPAFFPCGALHVSISSSRQFNTSSSRPEEVFHAQLEDPTSSAILPSLKTARNAPQTLTEKIVQEYAVRLARDKVVKAGDYVTISPH
jgi:hypothetical protein